MIHLTDTAAKQIQKIQVEEGIDPSTPIRIGIKAGGCSGFSYTFDFDSAKSRFDLAFESSTMTILVDKKSHLFIDGTVIDWSFDMVNQGLLFTNPMAKGSCGCGTSFIYDPPAKETALPVFELKF